MQAVLPQEKKDVLSGAFFWLTAFYICYCGRPEDFVIGLSIIPVAKITSLAALVSLLMAANRAPRRFKDLPKEATYLLVVVGLLFLSAFLSPVWRGGAVISTIEFAKAYVAWVMTFLLVTSLKRVRRIIFIQSVSVVAICVLAIVKGHSIPRLNGVIGGFYSNPNDMAFAIVLSLPFCLAFLLSAKGGLRKLLWSIGMLMMAVTLMLTASRAGFIDLVVAGTVCLWHFGVKGKRFYLIFVTMILGAALMLIAGRSLMHRFAAISGNSISSQEEDTAHASYEERRILMIRALDAIIHYPILGVGAENFVTYSGLWKEVHASYLQIAAEGGIPILVLYLMFFARGFSNLRWLKRSKKLDCETDLFVGALKASLVGFVVGACFAPEAYQFFPYFTVCYTSIFFAMAKEQDGGVTSAKSQQGPPRGGFATGALGSRRSSVFTPAG